MHLPFLNLQVLSSDHEESITLFMCGVLYITLVLYLYFVDLLRIIIMAVQQWRSLPPFLQIELKSYYPPLTNITNKEIESAVPLLVVLAPSCKYIKQYLQRDE